MQKKVSQTKRFGGVWSATPTPFTEDLQVDTAAVERMVEHHIRLGVKGLFLCGSCGEGPWMTDRQRETLIRATAAAAAGRLFLAAQVTDNSSGRILDNIDRARAAGAGIAVIAPPYEFRRTSERSMAKLYCDAIRQSPLPVGIYDRGTYSSVVVPDAALEEIYAEPNVVLVKDSSSNPDRMRLALRAREQRPTLRLLDGDEFHCVQYLEAGYDGLLLGGGIFNGFIAGQIMAAVAAGHSAQAQALQDRMNCMMWDVYGGKSIECWLTGLRQLLVRMGLFTTIKGWLEYPLTESCAAAIETVLMRDRDILFP